MVADTVWIFTMWKDQTRRLMRYQSRFRHPVSGCSPVAFSAEHSAPGIVRGGDFGDDDIAAKPYAAVPMRVVNLAVG